MNELVAWVLLPVLMVAACTGTGLLAERLCGARLHPALVPAFGFAAAIAAIGPGYALGLGAEVAIAVLAVTTAAGAVSARAELRERFRPGLGALAGTGVYALYIAPVVLGGEATFLGYNLLNDTAIHLALVDHLADHGRHTVALEPSSYASAIETYVGNSYPLGSHELLTALRGVFDIEPALVYHPFIAVAAGLAASALYALLVREGAPGWAAAAAAAVALSGQLLFSFGLQGGIKELTFLPTLIVCAAIGAELLRTDRPVRMAAALALPAIAAYSIYGIAAMAWLGPLFAILLIWALRSRGAAIRERLVASIVTAALVFGVLGAPTVVASFEFLSHGSDTLTAESELGPLVGPIRTVQAAGIWLKGDYRQLPDAGGRRTYILIGVALALAALGAGMVLRRRSAGPLLLVLPALIAWFVVSRGGSPYVDAKLLALLSPAVVLFACIGVAVLWRERTRPEAALAALVLVGAIAFSDALAYRQANPAPMDRLDELAEIGERFEGRGPLMVNEFEEYAKHFARGARAVDPYEFYSPSPAKLRNPSRPVNQAYTLDELTLPYVQGFELIATRRSPAESRPPAGYRKVFAGRFYDVWERTGAARAAAHEPGGDRRDDPVVAASAMPCERLRALGSRGPLVAAERPRAVVFDIAAFRPLPAGWKPAPNDPLGLDARTGGVVSATAKTGGGRHRVWLRGRAYRDDELLVDGRRVGVASHPNGSKQWIDAGTVDLAPGAHTVELRRPRRSLSPGDGRSDLFGPVVLEPVGEPRLVEVPRGEGDRLCGRSLDWVEQLRQ